MIHPDTISLATDEHSRLKSYVEEGLRMAQVREEAQPAARAPG
jgi:hypothetical protein